MGISLQYFWWRLLGDVRHMEACASRWWFSRCSLVNFIITFSERNAMHAEATKKSNKTIEIITLISSWVHDEMPYLCEEESGRWRSCLRKSLFSSHEASSLVPNHPLPIQFPTSMPCEATFPWNTTMDNLSILWSRGATNLPISHHALFAATNLQQLAVCVLCCACMMRVRKA